MWNMSQELIDRKLEIINNRDVKIPALFILSDLNVFLRADDVLAQKFDHFEELGSFENAKGWMVKCDQEVLQK